LAEFERADGELKQLGLSLAEGKSLVYEAQRALVNAQAHGFVAASRNCLQCGAKSAVIEVVSLRCAKKRQMRWTNKGAHLLVQVRVAALNGELKMRDTADRRRTLAEQKRDDHWQCVAWRCLQF
jgi:hypothetical protein